MVGPDEYSKTNACVCVFELFVCEDDADTVSAYK